jgi:histidyl-tRNA synthetase
MKALGINNFTIKINNRVLLNGLLKYFSLEDKQLEILRTMISYQNIGIENVCDIY